MKIGNTTLTSLQLGITALTLATAVIHLVLGIGSGGAFGIIFILNFLGYLALWAAVYMDIAAVAQYRHLARWAFMAYTAVTIILYFVLNSPDTYNALGYATKAIEAALLVLLFVDSRS